MNGWMPHTYSLDAQAAFRTTYALFLLAQLAITLPRVRTFFTSERYGGYVSSSWMRDRLYHPILIYAAVAVWVVAAIGLVFDRSTFACAVASYAACRFVLTDPRWSSLSRGFGAVGHVTNWTNLALVMLELSRFADDASGTIRTVALFVFRADFAMIMIVAGVYKLTAGYASNDGYQIALANPWWCFWSALYRRLNPTNVLFRIMNHCAYGVEIVAGLLMLTPLREFGAAAIALSFAYLATQLRLAFLPGMVAGCYFLFVPHGGRADALLHEVFKQGVLVPAHVVSGAYAPAIAAALWTYLALVVLVRLGLCYNFYGRARLPGLLQSFNDAIANVLVVTLWRVFTANVVNFYIDVRLVDEHGIETPYEHIGIRSLPLGLRFAHAGEFVALCTTFTALKYFPDNFALFEERALRYARTIPLPLGKRVVLVYTAIDASAAGFAYTEIARFVADPGRQAITEHLLAPGRDPRTAAAASSITYAAKPGSYAPG